MCEFISAVEKEGHYLYLTDDEIFSELGRERLAGCNDNDIIGHGACRKFYNIPKNVGVNREWQNFWIPNVPAEIQEKLKNFDRWWGLTFVKYFQNDDLRYIIADALEEWKAKAKKILNTK